MGLSEAVSSGFGNYVNFVGRAVRSEYWYWVLFVVIVDFAASLIDQFAFGTGGMSGTVGVISSLAGLALFLPSLAVAARRLHDTDRSGWWLLIGLIPIIGAIVLIVWFCTAGTPGPNSFDDAAMKPSRM